MPSRRIEGYRFFFYSNDHDPPHVHVQIDGYEIRLRIANGEPFEDYARPTSRKIQRAGDVVRRHREELQELWDDTFD